MSNLLSIPIKQPSGLSIRDAVRDYIRQHHPDTHPDAFRHDIARWERAQDDALSSPEAAIRYQALLAQILNKLPSNIQLSVTYSLAFSPNAPPKTIQSLEYERRCVLWNAAVLHSQLANSADRGAVDGIKRAVGDFWCNAAGILDCLLNLKQEEDLGDDELSANTVRSIQSVMLAQAQECGWQLAVLENKSSGLVAKIAQEVSTLYAAATNTPHSWSNHVKTKAAHFAAAAQYRASIEHNAKHDYGAEVARLDFARAEAQRGVSAAIQVAGAVMHDIQALRDKLSTEFTRAERDNDLIYHNTGVRLKPPIELPEPRAILGQEEPLFAALVPWGARVAIDVFREKKEAAVRAVEGTAQELDKEAAAALRKLGQPAALEALERPAGLPPSIIGMMKQVRLENGPERITQKQETLDALKDADRAEMEAIWGMLDSEESPPEELVEHAKAYEGHLDTAAASDVQVMSKWEDVVAIVETLTWSEDDMAKTIPAAMGPGHHSPESRALRIALNQLEDHRAKIIAFASRARSTAAGDDITQKIQRQVNALGRWDHALPAAFGDLIDESVSQYDEMLDVVHAMREGLLQYIDAVRERDEKFRGARKGASAVRDRERKLRELEEAHSRYVEVNANLNEGIKVRRRLAP
ncbi:BRO1-domain-containing protein [Auriculariales sp. MPI-PUGE-AT-0066]|nr:BRO1-domain-containing protein [Auriculariales sp. MPI-PUGE-AT-0066]